jgi:membrane-associated phospholipid phosphatase
MTRPGHLSMLKRLLMMFAGWGTVGVCYSIGRVASGAAHPLRESFIDRLIPFDASAVWLYLSFFAFVPAAYLFAPAQRVKPLMLSMQLCAALSAIVFVLWPTTLHYPLVNPNTPSGVVWRFLAENDSSNNCLPSLHGALTALCIAALWRREKACLSALMSVWGIAIMWSVVQARRHLTLDLTAGILLGAICACLIARLLTRFGDHPIARASLNVTMETHS